MTRVPRPPTSEYRSGPSNDRMTTGTLTSATNRRARSENPPWSESNRVAGQRTGPRERFGEARRRRKTGAIGRASPPERRRGTHRILAPLGSLRLGASVGNGARGLQRDRRGVGLLSPRRTRARAPTAGAKTASSASATTTSACASRSAFWNGEDPILKERFFGLSGPEGNHGEDVKEYYFYLDNVPTHSYMKALYKYPHRAFPYDDLVRENARRTKEDPEYELLDTGIFADDAYFDVTVEYAKFAPDDIADRDHGRRTAAASARALHVLPTLWFRNTWSWEPARQAAADGRAPRDGTQRRSWREHRRPRRALPLLRGAARVALHRKRDQHRAHLRHAERVAVRQGRVPRRTSSTAGTTRSTRAQTGTKAAARVRVRRSTPGASAARSGCGSRPRSAATAIRSASVRSVLAQRGAEADAFYAAVTPYALARGAPSRAAPGVRRDAVDEAVLPIRRRATGSTATRCSRRRRAARWHGRNHDWQQLFSDDILSMPDNWEYPWFAAWDLAFHVIAARADRSRFRQTATAAADARMVHAPERPDPGLRVGVRRRQPAGARVGGAAHLPDRGEDDGRAAITCSSSASSRSCC